MRNEIWKEYPLDFGFEHQRKIFVSNFGRVKSVSQLSPDGKIISGSLQEGYPIIRIKLFKPRTAKVQEKIDAYNLEVSLIQEQIRDLKKEDILLADKMEEIEKLDNERKSVISKRSSYIRNTDKKRTFHFHFLIHRAVAELFLEQKEGEEQVIHLDFNKENNHVQNLEWATKEEVYNRFQKHPANRINKLNRKLGVKKLKKMGTSKLEKSEVLYIKEKLSKGSTLRELAKRFDVSDMQIHRIKTGENWSEVKTVSELKAERRKRK